MQNRKFSFFYKSGEQLISTAGSAHFLMTFTLHRFSLMTDVCGIAFFKKSVHPFFLILRPGVHGIERFGPVTAMVRSPSSVG
jgi:hypothetical protein